jgi:hypothetical protein
MLDYVCIHLDDTSIYFLVLDSTIKLYIVFIRILHVMRLMITTFFAICTLHSMIQCYLTFVFGALRKCSCLFLVLECFVGN